MPMQPQPLTIRFGRDVSPDLVSDIEDSARHATCALPLLLRVADDRDLEDEYPPLLITVTDAGAPAADVFDYLLGESTNAEAVATDVSWVLEGAPYYPPAARFEKVQDADGIAITLPLALTPSDIVQALAVALARSTEPDASYARSIITSALRKKSPKTVSAIADAVVSEAARSATAEDIADRREYDGLVISNDDIAGLFEAAHASLDGTPARVLETAWRNALEHYPERDRLPDNLIG